MKIYGLIGFPLEHSFSKRYFSEKFEKENITGCSYRNFSMENIDGFPLLVRNTTGLAGLNVTIPYKEKVISFLDELDPVSGDIGAVNTIKISTINGDPYLKGYNTDAWGFEQSLKPYLTTNVRKALVLGTGGASKAVNYVLKNLGIDVLFVSRAKTKGAVTGYEALDAGLLETYKLIVNTTPLGTYPDTAGFPPIPYEHLTENHVLFDLVYNPPVSVFLSKGEEAGAQTVNGWEMLKLQAERAWDIWMS